MPFIKLSQVKTTEAVASDFFVNVDYISRISPRDTGAVLLMHDGSTVAVEQAPDTIADYVDQLEASRSSAEIRLSKES